MTLVPIIGTLFQQPTISLIASWLKYANRRPAAWTTQPRTQKPVSVQLWRLILLCKEFIKFIQEVPTNLIHNIYRETALLNLLPHVTGAIELKQSNLTCPYLVVKSMQGDSPVWLGRPHCSSHGNGMRRRPHQSLLHDQAFYCKSVVDIWFTSSWQKFYHRGPVSISDKTSNRRFHKVSKPRDFYL